MLSFILFSSFFKINQIFFNCLSIIIPLYFIFYDMIWYDDLNHVCKKNSKTYFEKKSWKIIMGFLPARWCQNILPTA